ncbi:MAG: hypothetical protein M0Z96_00885 [Actinomycetota bacterium]|nr:hypothetical protein [Actinomycetota bacterium]
MESKHDEQQIFEAIKLLVTNQVVSHSGGTNEGGRMPEDAFLITTKGGVRNLTARDIGLVDLNVAVIEGKSESTILEIMLMHSLAKRNGMEAGAVCTRIPPMSWP